jgi:hypothetical protein
MDEGGQTELGAGFFEAAHEEGALVHPLFDGAEGVLNYFAAAIENVRSGRHAWRSWAWRSAAFRASSAARPAQGLWR